MKPQQKTKFHQTQTFRALVAIALAAVLLTNSAIVHMDLLLIEREAVLGVEDDVATDIRNPGNPVALLTVYVDGGKATIHAEVEGVPEGTAYAMQWQNDLCGEFADVPGETGYSVSFDATAENMRCKWRVAITLLDD